MRSIASFIMRGRSNAIMMALLGGFLPIPLITQAVVSLVTLRKGWQEGILISLWAMLPALVATFIGDVSLAFAMISISAVVIPFATAAVLRFSVNWAVTIVSLVAFSCFGVIVTLIAGDLVVEIQTTAQKVFAEADANFKQSMLSGLTLTRLSGFVAMSVAMSTFLGLLVARWWQALLYNPGGFRSEFYRLRLNTIIALVSFIAAIYTGSKGTEYGFWTILVALPLLIAGLSLLHCTVARFRLSVGVLVAAYLGLFLVPPFFLLVILSGFTDAWLDYRKRFNLMQ